MAPEQEMKIGATGSAPGEPPVASRCLRSAYAGEKRAPGLPAELGKPLKNLLFLERAMGFEPTTPTLARS
jgi:hypothetical protein